LIFFSPPRLSGVIQSFFRSTGAQTGRHPFPRLLIGLSLSLIFFPPPLSGNPHLFHRFLWSTTCSACAELCYLPWDVFPSEDLRFGSHRYFPSDTCTRKFFFFQPLPGACRRPSSSSRFPPSPISWSLDFQGGPPVTMRQSLQGHRYRFPPAKIDAAETSR